MRVEFAPVPCFHPEELNCVLLRRSTHSFRPQPEGPLLTGKPKFKRETLREQVWLAVGQRKKPVLREINSAAEIGMAAIELVEKEVNLPARMAASVTHWPIVAVLARKPEIWRCKDRQTR
jgi:hypothetical protein